MVDQGVLGQGLGWACVGLGENRVCCAVGREIKNRGRGYAQQPRRPEEHKTDGYES